MFHFEKKKIKWYAKKQPIFKKVFVKIKRPHAFFTEQYGLFYFINHSIPFINAPNFNWDYWLRGLIHYNFT